MKTMRLLLSMMILLTILLVGEAYGQWSYNGTHIYNTNTGNVGIGTATPTSLLHVRKNMTEPRITVQNSGGAGGATFQMIDDATAANWKFKVTGLGGFRLRDHAYGLDVLTIEANSAANMLYISNTGGLGIGTSVPSAKLDVRGSDPDIGVVIQVGNSDLSHRMMLFGGRLNDPNPFIQWKEGDPLRFCTDEGGWSEKMRITSAGNVGIGTDLPAAKLDVNGGDALINGLTVGKGPGTANWWNSAFGDQALSSNTTGLANTAVGSSALMNNSTGYRNTAIGSQSLESDTSGFQNTAIGSTALMNNASGDDNTACGFAALAGNTTGIDNTAVGSVALMNNLTGNLNTALGAWALTSNSDGINNTASGYGALTDNTYGSFNLASGCDALYLNTTGSSNTAVGCRALFLNTTGHSNVALGIDALNKNADRSNLVAVGDSALYNNGLGAMEEVNGSNNTALGSKALYSNNTGYSNTAGGYHALYTNTSGSNNTAVGDGALLVNTTGSSNTALGQNALSASDNSYLTGLGHNTSTSSTGVGNSTVIGDAAIVTASDKVRIGDATMTVIEGQVAWSYPSDGRFKMNVTEDVKGIEFIKLLRPVIYNFDTRKYTEFLTKDLPEDLRNEYLNAKDFKTSSAIRHSGFVAQEVADAAAASGYDFNGVHAPSTDNDNYSIAYSQFVVPLVKAVQEQQEMIEELRMDNVELRKQNMEMMARIESLEKR